MYPDFLAEYTLTYDKTFREKHKFNAVAGYTFQENRFSVVAAGRGGNFTQQIPVLDDQVFTPTNTTQITNSASDGVNSRLMSYIGRISYDYDNRGFFDSLSVVMVAQTLLQITNSLCSHLYPLHGALHRNHS